jgi:pectinesterase
MLSNKKEFETGLAFTCCLPRQNQETLFDALVAYKDGNYTSVQDAINAISRLNETNIYHWRIFVQKGVYDESVVIDEKASCVQLVGAGAKKTVITSFEFTTLQIYSQSVDLINITIENTGLSAPYRHYEDIAALYAQGSNFRAYNVEFRSYANTLFAGDGTVKPQQFYKNCSFFSFEDVVFGNAQAYFYKCTIECLSSGIVATNFYEYPNASRGFMFDRCKILAAQDNGPIFTYLGTTTTSEHFSKVIYSNCFLQSNIVPVGWLLTKHRKSYEFAEYHNYGPGANISQRLNTSIQLTSSMRRALRGFANTNKWQECTLD